MNAKKIVITGGPGSGKTSLIHKLEKEGYIVKHEVSRDIIRKAQEAGIEQLFLEDPILFSEKLLTERLKQYEDNANKGESFVFYDRALPDVVAYMDFAEIEYPKHFCEACNENTYDLIFILPPWQDIYMQDNERYESFKEAVEISKHLNKTYVDYGYKVIEVPIGSLEERVAYILKQVQKAF